MTRKLALLLIVALPLPLGGCLASLAMSAAGMAMQSAQGEEKSNRHLQPAARAACSAQAAQYGTVHIIDVAQRSVGRIVVWGTVTAAGQRRSFECAFTDKVAGFKLREIRAQG
jgi:ABC-type enterochelin transport system permease subunit